MGGVMTRMWWGGDPDAVNPVSGLTRREIHLVQKSWAPLAAKPLETGTLAFKRLFNTHPETKQKFKFVRNLSEEEYTNNPQFKQHMYNFMDAVTTAVNKLNKPEVVGVLMYQLGDSHRKHDVQEKHFNLLKQVLVGLFTDVLHWDSKTLAAWSKTVDFWWRHVIPAVNARPAASS